MVSWGGEGLSWCPGWFWECPNGGKQCKYRHALPKDFVLKKDKKRIEKENQAISIEELIEKERATLDSSKLTKVTLETFVAWKKKKLKEKKDSEKKELAKKAQKLKAGNTGGLSGVEMFKMDPSMLARHVEEDDGDDFDLTREKEEDDGTKASSTILAGFFFNLFEFSKLNISCPPGARDQV